MKKIIGILAIIILLSSCGSSKCASAPYNWGNNCPAYR